MKDHNNNENYEKALKKIMETNKNIKYCYIQGPKGEKGDCGEKGEKGDKGDCGEKREKGDSGITNITVGKTETVSPDTPAEVQNVGTDENIILDFKIPRGLDGQEGPTGPVGEKGDTGPRGLPGEIGISEKITIDGTETIEPTEEALVTDDFESNMHHLTFYIPKGETGPIGPTGPVGAGAGATAYNAIISTRYADATDARSLTIKEKIFIPDPTNVFQVPSVINIDVKVTGIYEIMLCGKISGVTEGNGAKFQLVNITTGTIPNNLTFELKKGTTSNMTFSGTTITEIFAPATFQIKSIIDGDPLSSNITFSDINLIMKRYNT